MDSEYFDELDKELGESLSIGEYCLFALKKANALVDGKFASGRKASRTMYAEQAFGRYYPQEIKEYSRIIDKFTGMCDDINDDTMDREERALYMAALANNISLTLDNFPPEILKEFSTHIKKMLYIQTAEYLTLSDMSRNNEREKIIESGIKNYTARAIDMDVFIRLPALVLVKRENVDVGKLVKAGRNFRAVNLLHKDFRDIPHDVRNGTLTPVIALQKKDINVRVFTQKLMELLEDSFRNIETSIQSEAEEYIIHNLHEMSYKEYEAAKEIAELYSSPVV